MRGVKPVHPHPEDEGDEIGLELITLYTEPVGLLIY